MPLCKIPKSHLARLGAFNVVKIIWLNAGRRPFEKEVSRMLGLKAEITPLYIGGQTPVFELRSSGKA